MMFVSVSFRCEMKLNKQWCHRCTPRHAESIFMINIICLFEINNLACILCISMFELLGWQENNCLTRSLSHENRG